MKAVIHGHMPVVKTLLYKGANVNIRHGSRGHSALHLSADVGRVDIAVALLSAGADKNARCYRGITPLIEASIHGHFPVVEALLNEGADVNSVCQEESECGGGAKEGDTALILAAHFGHDEVAVALLDKGANKDFMFKDEYGCVYRTPLMHAAGNGHLPVVKTLLGRGADVTVVGLCQNTALHDAATQGSNDVVVALLSKGADKDACNSGGETPLIKATQKGHLPVVDTLLGEGADLTICIENGGKTALHFAARSGHLGSVLALLNKGAGENTCDRYQVTPLMMAAANGHLPVVEVLLGKDADPNISCTMNGGWNVVRSTGSFSTEELTALHFAIGYGDLSVVKALVDHGADVNARDGGSETPLHLASKSAAMVNMLLTAGADETAVDKDGNVPGDKGTPEVHILLARAPADRAWRRRGWLAMLRSRTLKSGGSGGSSADGGSSSDAGARSVKKRGGSGDGKEGLDLSAAVAWLTGVDDGVFRNVVGFL
eukprot:g16428.t1